VFDKTSMAATETAGTVSIPVTIASLEPISTTVTYSVDAEASTAVAGEHYNLVDPSAVLSFNGTDRTAYIEVEVLPNIGEFTGDKTVVIKLENANGINLGSEKVCTFTINDLDHPLSDILGTYTLTDGSTTKTITIEKDASDLTVVHFPDIMSGVSSWLGSGYSFDIFGQVSGEEGSRTIVIPLPVDTGYKYSNGESLMIYQGDANAVYYTGASVTLTQTSATTFSSGEFGLVGYIKGAGYVEWIDPFTLTKN
jgi:hypothetical protein